MWQEGNDTLIASSKIEALRLILEREQSRRVGFEEALEVAEGLIVFFELLAQDGEQLE